MFKKILLYLSLFAIFLLINFVFLKKLSKKYRQIALNQQLLDEIDNNIINSEYYSENENTASKSAKELISDIRVANLHVFFRKHNSPLYDYSQYIVQQADKYKFDYRLLPAIAMQESTLCKNIPINSYNCWGWGIYGNKITRFTSYEEAIERVSRGIKQEYIDKGLVTATAIMEKYTPSSNGSWAHGVNLFLRLIE